MSIQHASATPQQPTARPRADAAVHPLTITMQVGMCGHRAPQNTTSSMPAHITFIRIDHILLGHFVFSLPNPQPLAEINEVEPRETLILGYTNG